MSFSDFFFGSGPSTQQVGTLTGGQDDLLNQIIGGLSGSGPLAGLFGVNQDFFQSSFVDPALNTFQNRIAPAIQQKFIASGGARGSGLDDTLTRAGADVQGQLNQQLAGLINNAQNRALQGAQLGLGTQAFQNVQDPGSQGLFPELLSGIGAGFAGPFGGALGQGAGSFASNLFKQKGGGGGGFSAQNPGPGLSRRGQLQ
ncbi:MAG: hypothetical protein ABFQ95_01110 [Pseudomonadota bacterium]